MKAVKRPSNFYLILMLGALTALSPFSIDMYLPAFGSIASDFNIAVSEVSLSLSSYFIGLAIGQLFYGPLLDRFGRKRPLYVGLVLYIAATIGCLYSKNIEMLVAFRFLQALGGCAAQVASIAMVSDFFESKESAKIFSLLILILGASPLLAPTFGTYLAGAFGWHSVFIALTVIGLLLLATAFFFLPEGRQPDRSVALKPVPIFKTYASIFVDPSFYTYTFAGALAFSGLFVYLASSPVIFLEIFKVTPYVYGWIFGVMAAGFITSSQANMLFMRRLSSEQILLRGLFVLSAMSAVFLIGTWAGWYGMTATIAILFCYLASAGVIHPNASALALAPFATKNAGSASALMGAIQLAVGSAISIGVSMIHATEIFPFAVAFATTALLSLVALVAGQRRIKRAYGAKYSGPDGGTVLSGPGSV